MKALTLLIAAALRAAGAGPVDVSYCDLVAKPDAFKGKAVRVRAVYEIGFEKSVLTAAGCEQSPTWLGLNKGWQKQTEGGVAQRIRDLKWGVPTDVVVVGSFRYDGKFGHMGMYSRYLLVDRFEK